MRGVNVTLSYVFIYDERKLIFKFKGLSQNTIIDHAFVEEQLRMDLITEYNLQQCFFQDFYIVKNK